MIYIPFERNRFTMHTEHLQKMILLTLEGYPFRKELYIPSTTTLLERAR